MQDDFFLMPCHLVNVAARGFIRLSEARLKNCGIGIGQLPTLVALKDDKATSQKDLARFFRVEQPAVAQMLHRMQEGGLIHRSRDPEDGRSSRITLTEAAEARFSDAVEAAFRANCDVLEDFTAQEAEQLKNLLTKLISKLDGLNGDRRVE